MLWNRKSSFEPAPYKTEAELEQVIQEVKGPLFGASRVYLNIKKKIGAKGGKRNIPDGYLIDLSSKKKPMLYVVEVELERHEPLRHVAVQILEFSLAFESEPQLVKRVVRKALEESATDMKLCSDYAKANGHENVDLLLEHLIHDGDFAALVIIDELVDRLETVLVSKFRFGVEVIELERFTDAKGVVLYQFEPFLRDISSSAEGASIDTSELDTIVVPARPEGFLETFLGEDRWYEIRIHGSMIPKIKYIASYVTAPKSAITNVAPVDSIEPWKGGAKYVVNFAESASKIGPLSLVKGGRAKAPQGPRYTSIERLRSAKSLEDVF